MKLEDILERITAVSGEWPRRRLPPPMLLPREVRACSFSCSLFAAARIDREVGCDDKAGIRDRATFRAQQVDGVSVHLDGLQAPLALKLRRRAVPPENDLRGLAGTVAPAFGGRSSLCLGRHIAPPSAPPP